MTKKAYKNERHKPLYRKKLCRAASRGQKQRWWVFMLFVLRKRQRPKQKTRCEEPLARVGVIRLTLRTQGRYTVFTMGEQPHCLVIIPHRRDFVNVQNRRFSPKIFVTNAGCRKIAIFGSTKLWKMPIFLLKNIFFGGRGKKLIKKEKKALTKPEGCGIIPTQ